jgi:hypothetical protein
MDAETRFIADVMPGKTVMWLRFPGGCVDYFPPEILLTPPAAETFPFLRVLDN